MPCMQTNQDIISQAQSELDFLAPVLEVTEKL